MIYNLKFKLNNVIIFPPEPWPLHKCLSFIVEGYILYLIQVVRREGHNCKMVHELQYIV